MQGVSVQKLDWRQWPEFSSTWDRIHGLCPTASFFLSRHWVDCWLATFADELQPDLLVFRSGDDVVGCCILVRRTQWVRGIPLRRVYLNCAGEDEVDSTCIEYNTLLCLPDHERQVSEVLVDFLRQSRWDELVLPGMLHDSPLIAATIQLGTSDVSVRPTHYVDLQRLRLDAVNLDSVLSAKTRKNVRRSQRGYERVGGACCVQVAQSIEQALKMLQDLAKLHQVRWTERGRPGVFASAKFTSFHERLVRGTFSNGQVLLFQVDAAPYAIGLLYCFLDSGWVRFYQSGFDYTLDSELSPGLLTLYCTIRECLENQEFKAFDFLAGDSQYKRSLATDSGAMCWVVVRRRTLRSLVLRWLRFMKKRYHEVAKQVVGVSKSNIGSGST